MLEKCSFQHLCRDFKILDITGKKGLPALTVFSAVIGHLKSALWDKLKGWEFKEDDLYWVLTVPAIWGLKAKQFMTEAAEAVAIRLQYFLFYQLMKRRCHFDLLYHRILFISTMLKLSQFESHFGSTTLYGLST